MCTVEQDAVAGRLGSRAESPDDGVLTAGDRFHFSASYLWSDSGVESGIESALLGCGPGPHPRPAPRGPTPAACQRFASLAPVVIHNGPLGLAICPKRQPPNADPSSIGPLNSGA